MSTLTAQIKLRRDTSANWTSNNPVIGAGELVFTSDVFYTGTDFQKVKVGDGVQTWTNLDYLPVSGAGGTQTLAQTLTFGNTTSGNSIVLSLGDRIKTGGPGDIDFGAAGDRFEYWTDGYDNASEAFLFVYPTKTSSGTQNSYWSVEETQIVLLNPTLIDLDAPNVRVPYETPLSILSTDGSSYIKSLSTATYPSLTELAYVKGVTASIQTQINNKQPLDSTLTSLASYNTNGLITQTAADTFTGRTITGTSNEITVTDGNGVSGNPTLSIPTSLTFTGKTITGGTYSSPTLTTPVLGTPSSGTLTNCTGLPIAGITGYQGYTLVANTGAFAPADGTTYYYGNNYTNAATTTATNRRIYIPKTGTIKYVDISTVCTVGTSEATTLNLRLNNTTNTTISTTLNFSSAVQFQQVSGLSISVVAGDYIEMQFVAPTYATNPTNITITNVIYIE
jgi:hypothetical protein